MEITYSETLIIRLQDFKYFLLCHITKNDLMKRI